MQKHAPAILWSVCGTERVKGQLIVRVMGASLTVAFHQKLKRKHKSSVKANKWTPNSAQEAAHVIFLRMKPLLRIFMLMELLLRFACQFMQN